MDCAGKYRRVVAYHRYGSKMLLTIEAAARLGATGFMALQRIRSTGSIAHL